MIVRDNKSGLSYDDLFPFGCEHMVVVKASVIKTRVSAVRVVALTLMKLYEIL